MPQMTGFIYIFNLSIRQSGDAMRTPVDDPATFVDQPLFIKRHENLTHGPGTAFVHSETGAVPVTAGAQFLLLLNNTVSILMLPIPHTVKELFTTQIIASQTFFAKLLFNLNLSSNTGMVNTGDPQRVISLHPLETNQCILQSSIHRMTHVQLTCDVGRGHDDGEGFCISFALRCKVAIILPHLINAIFNLLRFIDLRQFSCHFKHSFSK